MDKKALFAVAAIMLLSVLTTGCSSSASLQIPCTSYTIDNTNGGLSSNRIFSIYRDNQGNIWIGTRRDGVFRFDGKKWRSITTKNGLSGDTVMAITQDNKGNMWFGTNGGATRFNGLTWTRFTHEDGLPYLRSEYGYIWDIFLDSKDNLWFAGDAGSVSRYDGSTWKSFTIGTAESRPSVTAIAEDHQGNIWFGTYGGGVTRYDGVEWKLYTSENGLVDDDVVYDIKVDSRGIIWVATRDGRLGIDSAAVSRFDGTNWTSFDYKDGLLGGYANAIEEDDQGNIWVGTGYNGGVSFYDGTAWHTFPGGEWLTGVDTRSIFKDVGGNLWFGIYKGGVSCYNTSLNITLPPPIDPEAIAERKPVPSGIGQPPEPGSRMDMFIKDSNLPDIGTVSRRIIVPEEQFTLFRVTYGYVYGDFGDIQVTYSEIIGIEYGDKIGWVGRSSQGYDLDASDSFLFTDEFWKLFEKVDDRNYHYAFLPFLAADSDVPRDVLIRLAESLENYIYPPLANALMNNVAVQNDIEILTMIAGLSSRTYSEEGTIERAYDLLEQAGADVQRPQDPVDHPFPRPPDTLDPPDHAINVPVNVTLRWNGGDNLDDEMSYEVWLSLDGTNWNPVSGKFKSTSIRLLNLSPGTTYYWHVLVYDNFGNISSSQFWEFTTAGNPSP